jgi:hypothetical protein
MYPKVRTFHPVAQAVHDELAHVGVVAVEGVAAAAVVVVLPWVSGRHMQAYQLVSSASGGKHHCRTKLPVPGHGLLV